MPKPTEKAIIGYCPGCDVQILDLSIGGRGRELENYRQTFFKLSDGSIMKVALCADCISGLNMELGQRIMERFRINWREEIESSVVIADERKDDVIEEHLSKELVETKIHPHHEMLRNRNADSTKEELHRQEMAELERVNEAIVEEKRKEDEAAEAKRKEDEEHIRAEEKRIKEENAKREEAIRLENERTELEIAKRYIK